MISKVILLWMVDVPMGWEKNLSPTHLHIATFHFNFPGMSSSCCMDSVLTIRSPVSAHGYFKLMLELQFRVASPIYWG